MVSSETSFLEGEWLFETSSQEIIQLAKIVLLMHESGISTDFIGKATKIAAFDQGMFDLMKLWSKVIKISDKQDILKEIQKTIFEYKI